MSRELDDFMSGRVRNPKQKEFFDSQAENWDTHAVHDPAKKAYIVGKLELEDGMSILDVGTGTGTMIPDYLGAMKGGHQKKLKIYQWTLLMSIWDALHQRLLKTVKAVPL